MIDKHIVETTITDLVGDFLYYNRKEDDELPVGSIEKAVAAGELTVDEMVALFRAELEKGCKPHTQ